MIYFDLTQRFVTIKIILEFTVSLGLKMTEPRKVIAKVLSESKDHPDVESLHSRVRILDPTISIATVYRTMKLFEDKKNLAFLKVF